MPSLPVEKRKRVERLLTSKKTQVYSVNRIATESGVSWFTVRKIREALGLPRQDAVLEPRGYYRSGSAPHRKPVFARVEVELVREVIELLQERPGRRAKRLLDKLRAIAPAAFEE